LTTRATTDNTGASPVRREENLKGTETKAAFKTTELIVYVLAVLGVLIASIRASGRTPRGATSPT
jgi:hypothetical protein